MDVWIGTSGWQYADWKGLFYPKEVRQVDWLPYFADRFPTVEINNTFYMLPKEETFVRWRQRVPRDFVFVVKASRYLTHIRRLQDPEEPIRLFWSRARRLGRKLGPVLFQLPPNLQLDLERLETFLRLLPKTMRAALEFRHPSWETPAVYEALDRRGCALVLAHRPGLRAPHVVTGGWSYVRFHQGTPKGPDYPRDTLRRWAERIAAMDARETWVFFNNDPTGAAIRDAFTLQDLLENLGVSVRGPVRELPAQDRPAE